MASVYTLQKTFASGTSWEVSPQPLKAVDMVYSKGTLQM